MVVRLQASVAYYLMSDNRRRMPSSAYLRADMTEAGDVTSTRHPGKHACYCCCSAVAAACYGCSIAMQNSGGLPQSCHAGQGGNAQQQSPMHTAARYRAWHSNPALSACVPRALAMCTLSLTCMARQTAMDPPCQAKDVRVETPHMKNLLHVATHQCRWSDCHTKHRSQLQLPMTCRSPVSHDASICTACTAKQGAAETCCTPVNIPSEGIPRTLTSNSESYLMKPCIMQYITDRLNPEIKPCQVLPCRCATFQYETKQYKCTNSKVSGPSSVDH